MTQQLRLRAPSGRRVQIDLPATPGVSNIASSIRFAGGSMGRGFQIGPRGYHDFALKYMVKGTNKSRLVVHGREVVVAEADDGSHTTTTLIGDYHELMTVFSGESPESRHIIALFKALDIEDAVEGMKVTPKSATLMGVMSEVVIVNVNGRGSISVPDASLAKTSVPKFSGAKTKHGEVWRTLSPGVEKASSIEDYSFTLGFTKGVAEVTLRGPGDVAEDVAMGWMNEINVAWAD